MLWTPSRSACIMDNNIKSTIIIHEQDFVYTDYQINSIMKENTITVQHRIKTLHILVHKFYFFNLGHRKN